MTPAEEEIFKTALAHTGRDAFTQFKRAEGVDNADPDAVRAAGERFRTQPLLLDPQLRTACLQVLADSRGAHADDQYKLPLTIWGGAFQIDGGHAHDGVIADFVDLLHERAQVIAPKREGLVVEPTTTTDGRRTNESAVAEHALFLDCDAAGGWHELLNQLTTLNVAHVAYQSGGWTPTSPKWRVVIPLERPFNVAGESAQTLWKLFYHQARVVFGAIAGLHGIGFDAATNTPCCPWFLTEKRAVDDPPREIRWRAGHSLDTVAMVLALPAVEEVAVSPVELRAKHESMVLANDRLEEIVAALAAATASVPANRRDLYLALPGVLLDRGLDPDDVFVVCEAVSKRYPRHHPDKHADNLHCARTTIARWERDDRVTRIGTLNSISPQIARIVDEVLPDPDRAEFLEHARRLARRKSSAPPPPTTATTEEDAPSWSAPVDLKMLRKFALQMRRRKKRAITSQTTTNEEKDVVHWILLDRMLQKKPLASPIECDTETQLGREDALYRLMGMLAFRFPTNTPVEIVVELLRPSVFLSLESGESADKWLKMAQRWYVLSLASRLEMDAKRDAERKAEQERERQLRIAEAKRCVL